MLNIEKIKSIKSEFDKVESDKQWEWFLNMPHRDSANVYLDNDSTCFVMKCEPESEDENPLIKFKDYTGSASGVGYLLTALGINWESA